MRIKVLATEVWAREKMKQVEAVAMQSETITTGRPPSRHWATMLRPRTTHSTTAKNSEANRLRQRLVVQGLVVTRRAMSPPLLQQTAAQATSRPPRRAADVAGSRRVALLPRLDRIRAAG